MSELANVILAFFTIGSVSGSDATLAVFAAYLGAISFVGTTGMAVVQAIKEVLPLRAWYQRWRVRQWFNAHLNLTNQIAASLPSREAEMGARANRNSERESEQEGIQRQEPSTYAVIEASISKTEHRRAAALAAKAPRATRKQTAANPRQPSPDAVTVVEMDLVALAVDGDYTALYSLEPEQMTSQLKTAFQMALNAPHRHEALLRIAGAFADQEDLVCILSPVPQDNAQRLAFADARSRVGQQLQRAVDALSISVAYRWQSWIHLLALLVCFAITAVIVKIGAHQPMLANLVAITVTGLLATFVAPLARDLVAAIGKLRG
jgi:hypothetical protein